MVIPGCGLSRGFRIESCSLGSFLISAHAFPSAYGNSLVKIELKHFHRNWQLEVTITLASAFLVNCVQKIDILGLRSDCKKRKWRLWGKKRRNKLEGHRVKDNFLNTWVCFSGWGKERSIECGIKTIPRIVGGRDKRKWWKGEFKYDKL
jgi:hypothetical protein